LSVKKGDFIRVDYVAKIKETGETFDATIAEEAKKGGIFKENTVYEPMFVVVGEKWVLEKLDNSLVDIEVDAQTTIEISPEEGFGLRDPTKVRVIPISRFKKQEVNPYPGAQIEIDGKTAVVRSIGGGRVQVDFNSPLAGKTLIYELIVKKTIEDKLDKIRALIHRRIPNISVGKFTLNVAEKEIMIEVPEEAFYLQVIQFAKRGMATDLQTFFSMEKVVFTEVFTKPSLTPSEEQPKQGSIPSDT